MHPEIKTRDALGCELAAEVLRVSGKLRLRVTGASMLPAIWPGDVLDVRGFDSRSAKPGDVVLCQRDGHLVAHRVVQRIFREGRAQWVLRGDNVSGNDAAVPVNKLLGLVVAVKRGSKRLGTRPSIAGKWVASILCRFDLATRVLLRASRILF